MFLTIISIFSLANNIHSLLCSYVSSPPYSCPYISLTFPLFISVILYLQCICINARFEFGCLSICRCSLPFGTPVPVLPVRNNLRRPNSSHFPQSRFQFRKGLTSKCTWKCTAIVFIIFSVVLTAALTYMSGKCCSKVIILRN